MDRLLETARLTLVPLTVELIDAISNPNKAVELLGAEIPDGWPDAELAGYLPLYAGWVRENPAVVGYGPWAVIVRGERVVVGSAGFVGRPTPEGSIEMGFGIHPDYRRRGYASEAARALLEWGLDQPRVERVVATCEPGNGPSIGVLEKIGMTRTPGAGDLLKWETTRTGR